MNICLDCEKCYLDKKKNRYFCIENRERIYEAPCDYFEQKRDDGSENPWHTGTPTEEGWYLCSTKASDFSVHHYDGNEWDLCPLDFVVAWQKIEPYKEDCYASKKS